MTTLPGPAERRLFRGWAHNNVPGKKGFQSTGGGAKSDLPDLSGSVLDTISGQSGGIIAQDLENGGSFGPFKSMRDAERFVNRAGDGSRMDGGGLDVHTAMAPKRSVWPAPEKGSPGHYVYDRDNGQSFGPFKNQAHAAHFADALDAESSGGGRYSPGWYEISSPSTAKSSDIWG